MSERVIGIGLFGANGHQIHQQVGALNGTILAAACAMPGIEFDPQVRQYAQFAELLADPQVGLVSICAPMRSQQVAAIRQALLAGKHVYAEKPCVLTRHDLDALLALSQETGCALFEMAGTAFEEPYATVREIVQSGALGHVVQVCAQKSYPYGDWRPQDEDVDGGLILQNGIHAVRMIEHVAGCRVQAVSTIATGVGNPKTGNLQMAASASFRFEGGGLGSAIFNYLNQPGHGVWGNEYVRVFGTHAFIETDLKACHTRLVDAGGETIFPARPRIPYLQFVIDALLGRAARPFSIEQEFHPTRVVIAARQSAMQAGEFIEVDF